MTTAIQSAPRSLNSPFGGLYPWMGAEPPHPPSYYVFPKYTLTGSFGKAEAEEVAARLVALCQQQGAWVTIGYSALCQMVLDELNAGLIQNSELNSLFADESLRFGPGSDDWITYSLAIGIHYLKASGYVTVGEFLRDGKMSLLVTPTPAFFGPLAAFAA